MFNEDDLMVGTVDNSGNLITVGQPIKASQSNPKNKKPVNDEEEHLKFEDDTFDFMFDGTGNRVKSAIDIDDVYLGSSDHYSSSERYFVQW